MTDQATATVRRERPEPTAIEPSRVLVLNDDEQRTLLAAVGEHAPTRRLVGDKHLVDRIADRIAFGDEYINPTDELVRTTLRKRRLEAEVKRCNIAIERCTDTVVDELAERGDTGGKHAGTGATYRIDRKVWARLDVDTDGLPKDQADALKQQAKARAGDALIDAGLGDFVRSDFNLNTVSAYFREQIKTHDADQAELPEHERQPLNVNDLLPDELRGLLKLDDTPTITVRA